MISSARSVDFLGRRVSSATAAQIVGRLAFAAGLIDRDEAITPAELIPLFDWGKVPKEDLTISM